MSSEHLDSSALDAKPETPAAPPPNYIPVDLLPVHAMERIEHLLSQEEKDTLHKARIAGRDAKRAAAAKAKEEDAASSKRAADAVKDVIERGEKDGEDKKPVEQKPGEPAFELEVSELIEPSKREAAQGYAEDVAAIATDAGIPQEEAQVILDSAIDIALTIMPSGEEPNLANESECMAVMNSRWGDIATKSLVQDANKAVERLGPAVRAWLNSPSEFGELIGNSPAVVYALAAWQRGHTRMSPEKAASEVARLRALPDYQSGNKNFTDQVALLTKVAARKQPVLGRSTPPAVKSSAQAEIEKIRKDPDYASLDAKKRAPLVARMNALMTQVYGA